MSGVKRKREREEHVYFDNGKFIVSDRNLKTPRKTYRLGRIEKIGLRRDPFYFALALCIPAIGLLLAFNNYLYNYERVILIVGPLAALYVTSRLGVLYVESKALADMAAIAPISTLRTVRAAVEEAIDDIHDGADSDDT